MTVTTVVKVQQAKTQLSALLASVEHGEEVVISRGNTPVARLVPIQGGARRELGFLPFEVSASFFEPLPDEELAAWEA